MAESQQSTTTPPPDSGAALSVDIWSDIACPWCWVGKRRLDEAVAGVDFALVIRWHAFELDPSAAREAPQQVDYARRLAEKYATSREEAQAMIDRMVATGEEENGVTMRFDRIRPSRTFDAHRLLAWAGDTGGEQTALKERLFGAYLGEGRAMSDLDTLAELATEVGLDGAAAAEVLRSDRYAEAVRADEREAARLGIRAVPFFVFDRRVAVSGAHPPDALREAMRQALAAA